jgi:hypothetical protein
MFSGNHEFLFHEKYLCSSGKAECSVRRTLWTARLVSGNLTSASARGTYKPQQNQCWGMAVMKCLCFIQSAYALISNLVMPTCTHAYGPTRCTCIYMQAHMHKHACTDTHIHTQDALVCTYTLVHTKHTQTHIHGNTQPQEAQIISSAV